MTRRSSARWDESHRRLYRRTTAERRRPGGLAAAVAEAEYQGTLSEPRVWSAHVWEPLDLPGSTEAHLPDPWW